MLVLSISSPCLDVCINQIFLILYSAMVALLTFFPLHLTRSTNFHSRRSKVLMSVTERVALEMAFEWATQIHMFATQIHTAPF